jgi:hypothetical protein
MLWIQLFALLMMGGSTTETCRAVSRRNKLCNVASCWIYIRKHGQYQTLSDVRGYAIFLTVGNDIVGKHKMNTGTHFIYVSNGYFSTLLPYNQTFCMYICFVIFHWTKSHTHCPEKSKRPPKNGANFRHKLPMDGAFDTDNSALIVSHILSNGFNEHYISSI